MKKILQLPRKYYENFRSSFNVENAYEDFSITFAYECS